MNRKEFYSPKDAAELLNVSKRTIQHRCQVSDIRKTFGRYQIPHDDLEAWANDLGIDLSQQMAQNTQEGASNVRNSTQGLPLRNVSTDELILELKRRNDVDHIEGYTEVEYQEFLYRLKDYKRMQKELEDATKEMDEHIRDLRNERDYLRQSVEGYRNQIDKIYDSIQRRDWIEAKRERLDAGDNIDDQ